SGSSRLYMDSGTHKLMVSENGATAVPLISTGVSSLNSLTGALSITAGTGVTVTPSGANVQIAIGQSVATTAAVTFASLNAAIVFRKENSTNEGGSFILESPDTATYPQTYVDNFQGYLRFIGTFGGVNCCPVQIWGKAGVAGLDVLAGWVQSEAGFATASTSATAVNVTGAGGGVFADYLTADEFLKLTSKSSAPASISGSYGGLAHKSGGTYWYWNGSAWAEANFASMLPSGSSGQTLRHDGTSWVASSALQNNGTNVTMTGSLSVTGTASTASINVTNGYVQTGGGFYTTSTSQTAIQAPSGGVYGKWLSTDHALYLLTLGTSTTPDNPSGRGAIGHRTGSTYYYWTGSAWSYVDFALSLPSGTTSYTLRYNGSAWVSSSVLQNDGSTITASGAVRLSGGHLYLANDYSIYLKDSYGNDRVAITRASDNHLYIDNVSNSGDIYLRPADGRYVIIGQGSSSNAYLIPNTAGGTNSVGTSTYPWDEVNAATYKYGSTTLINSSGQFVGLGIAMQSYACGASGFNCYSGGAWKYGQTVTRYDRDGNAMTFYGGILAS
ncbi:MAG TPA: hypothetical protein PKJ41_03760, partial [Bryobacteraceae bacterium]|nr:hypothetical protein [Bryobacteraceae bacterium]